MIKIKAREYIAETEKIRSEISALSFQINQVKEQMEPLPRKVEVLQEAKTFLQSVSEAARDEVVASLEQIVTLCVQIVFGEHYEFKINVKPKNNAVAVDFVVIDNSGSVPYELPPDYSFGGGMVDTISIGLRFGLLKILPNPPAGPIILDEPAKMVSKDKTSAIASLISEMSEVFERQIIMITHVEEIMNSTHTMLYVQKEDGVSVVTKGGANNVSG